MTSACNDFPNFCNNCGDRIASTDVVKKREQRNSFFTYGKVQCKCGVEVKHANTVEMANIGKPPRDGGFFG